MIHVLIVEDDPMAKRLLEIFVEQKEGYRLVSSLDCANMAEFYCATSVVDLILMDVHTAMNQNGMNASENIKKEYPHIKIILMTSQPECSYLEKAHTIGIDSFWYKTSVPEGILMVMDKTMAGESVYPEETPLLKVGNAFSREFTSREQEVLRELTTGKSDGEIAEKLHMSIRTVKAHIQNMREKTGFRNRTELAVKARESGFVISE